MIAQIHEFCTKFAGSTMCLTLVSTSTVRHHFIPLLCATCAESDLLNASPLRATAISQVSPRRIVRVLVRWVLCLQPMFTTVCRFVCHSVLRPLCPTSMCLSHVHHSLPLLTPQYCVFTTLCRHCVHHYVTVYLSPSTTTTLCHHCAPLWSRLCSPTVSTLCVHHRVVTGNHCFHQLHISQELVKTDVPRAASNGTRCQQR